MSWRSWGLSWRIPITSLINDTGVFTEYIVDLSGGEIVSTTYVSEENLTVGRAEAEGKALSGQPRGARVEKIVLKVYGNDRIVWEVTVRAGQKTDAGVWGGFRGSWYRDGFCPVPEAEIGPE